MTSRNVPPPHPTDEGDDLLEAVGAHVRATQAAGRGELPMSDADFRSRATARFMSELDERQSSRWRPQSTAIEKFRWSAPLALAAAMGALWVSTERDTARPDPMREPAELAQTTTATRGTGPAGLGYRAEVQGAVAHARGASTSETLRLSPTTPLTIVLRPEAPVQGMVDARAFIVQDDGAVSHLVSHIERSPVGSLRLVLPATVALPAAGTLTVLVGAEGQLTKERALAPTITGAGWQRFTWHFTRED